MIRVVIADDHHLVRQGIRALLDKADDMKVVGEAADGQDAIDLVAHLNPDVLVMDISMPRLSGTQAIERLRSQQATTRVLILSMYSDEAVVRQVLRNGARGYLLKNALAEELLQAIRAANRGATYLSPAISESIMAELATSRTDDDGDSPFSRLSPREREVLQLIAEGHTNNAIAQLMNVAVKTVEKHRASIMSKLNVHDVAGLVRFALKHGLIFLDK
jgi:DNA-binding NarL/FixJ family response regulator